MDNSTGVILLVCLVCIGLQGRQIQRLQADVDLLASGDTETLNLRRKLEGRGSD